MGRIPDWTPQTYDPLDVLVGEPLAVFPRCSPFFLHLVSGGLGSPGPSVTSACFRGDSLELGSHPWGWQRAV